MRPVLGQQLAKVSWGNFAPVQLSCRLYAVQLTHCCSTSLVVLKFLLFLCSAVLFCVFRFYQFFCFCAVLLDISGAQVIIVLFYCWCSSLVHGTWFWRCGQAVRFRPPAHPHADALDDNNTTTPEVSALLSVLSFFLLTSPSHLACAPQVAPWPSQACPCATDPV